MNLRALIGRSLKSPEVIEVLNSFDLKVVYDFDRSGKNVPDCYRASAPQDGFELCFDQNQRLRTVFMYVSPQNGFRPIKPDLMAAPHFASFKEAESFFLGEGWGYFACRVETWIECKCHDLIIHYDFNPDGGMGLVKLMDASDA